MTENVSRRAELVDESGPERPDLEPARTVVAAAVGRLVLMRRSTDGVAGVEIFVSPEELCVRQITTPEASAPALVGPASGLARIAAETISRLLPDLKPGASEEVHETVDRSFVVASSQRGGPVDEVVLEISSDGTVAVGAIGLWGEVCQHLQPLLGLSADETGVA